MIIGPSSSLREVAFVVCTALERAGSTAVLTGGSAATVYAPHAYQSRDLDFVMQFQQANSRPGDVLRVLGFTLSGDSYVHLLTSYTLDFPRGPLQAGEEYLEGYATLREGEFLLHILRVTDCCKDRLAGFIHWKDRSSLEQAVSVAQAHPELAELNRIREWMQREGAGAEWKEFKQRVTG